MTSAGASSAAATGAATAAAAARRQREHEEEEQMTPYTEADLRDGWEFKIVRSAFRTFRDAGKLERLCRDEARAGGVLLEKFDDSRLRFKRPASARKNDAMLEPGIDPYRTWVGASETRVGLTIGAMVVGAILLGLAVAVSVAVLDG